MKSKLILFILIVPFIIYGQLVPNEYEIAGVNNEFSQKLTTATIDVLKIDPALDLTTFEIRGTASSAISLELRKSDDNTVIQSGLTGNSVNTIVLGASGLTSFKGVQMHIYDAANNTKLEFKIIDDPDVGNGSSNRNSVQRRQGITARKYFLDIYGDAMKYTSYGITLKKNSLSSGQNEFTGSNFVHIFLDQTGNSIFSTIPQGIQGIRYVVHVYYTIDLNCDNIVSYNINETASSFSDVLVFENSEGLGGLENSGCDNPNAALESTTTLSTSTSDISFTLERVVHDRNIINSELSRVDIKSYKIKMTAKYNGSLDIGILNSQLANPKLTFEPLDENSEAFTIKRDEFNDRGMVTGMATLYASPIVFLEKLLGFDVPEYKLSGRSYLNDHAIYERIFPTVGLSINESTFKNIFYGFNWEIARGARIFGGRHYGQISTLNIEDFEFGTQQITEQEFNLNVIKDWKSEWVYGITLDLRVLTGLLNRGNALN